MGGKSLWRRIGLAVAAVLVVVLVIGSITLFSLTRRPLPDASGEFAVDGLSAAVQVLRDERGIPQIYADSSRDLFLAQGYVHAQDRFFEMDLRRHVTAGRLSELVGEAGLETDRVIRTLGWRGVAEQEWPLLSTETRSFLQAYADGVNAYIDSRSAGQLALEYTVLGLQVDVPEIEPWTPIDSLAWLKAMAWDLSGNHDDELGRAATYAELSRYGDDVALQMVSAIYPANPAVENLPILPTPDLLAEHEALREVGEPVDGAGDSEADDPDDASSGEEPPAEAQVAEALAGVSAALRAVPSLLGEGDAIGSNSWVIGGEHTASGEPLLANDPHLGLTQPGIWYQVGLHCRTVGPDCPFEVAGFSFAGLPGVVIGQNADLAWGFTNLPSDAIDLVLERLYPDGTYLRDGERLPVVERREVISVAGGQEQSLVVRSTPNGPIVSDVIADSQSASGAPVPAGSPPAGLNPYAVAMQWTALTPGVTADAIFLLNRAQDAEDVAAAAALFEVPTQNIVFATATGDIGYQAPGRIPIRPQVAGAPVPNDGSWPRPGWDSAYDWAGFVPPEEMPSALNPEEGFIVAANQPVLAPGEAPFISRDFDYGYRSQAIRDAIEAQIAAGEPFTVADMNEMHLIDINPAAEMLVPILQQVPLDGDDFTGQAVALLEDWDLRNDADSAAAAYFAAVWTNVLRLTFWDQVPTSQRPTGGSRWIAAVAGLAEVEDHQWWDDRATLTVVEQRDQVLAQAMIDARLQLTVLLGKDPGSWSWGQLHQAAPQHQVLGGESVLGVFRMLVNPEPIGVAGGSSIVNANGWDASAWDEDEEFPDFTVTAVPSMRMVIDMADRDASTWVQTGGNSGHPLSPQYADQFEAWADGGTFAWPFSRAAVEDASQNTLTLSPPG